MKVPSRHPSPSQHQPVFFSLSDTAASLSTQLLELSSSLGELSFPEVAGKSAGEVSKSRKSPQHVPAESQPC